jgi:RNA polymerase sigma-70 factor (ECF subfamily)
MSPEAGLETLMSRYQEGDLGAATALVNRLGPQLHRFFLAQVVSRQYADDLLQETWLRIHEVRHTYRPGQPVLPWFYAIARNVRVDHYRRARRAGLREQALDEASVISNAMRHETDPSPDLESLLGILPESQREVIAMLKISGMTLEEVARATSSSVGSVKQKAHRAYEKLREWLGAGAAPAGRKGGRA